MRKRPCGYTTEGRADENQLPQASLHACLAFQVPCISDSRDIRERSGSEPYFAMECGRFIPSLSGGHVRQRFVRKFLASSRCNFKTSNFPKTGGAAYITKKCHRFQYKTSFCFATVLIHL